MTFVAGINARIAVRVIKVGVLQTHTVDITSLSNTILALSTGDNVSAAMGILGAIAGYLFGVTTSSSEKE